ncbi:MAG TPA: ROK family protein, partial [Geoalkalibacter subterraneus]|nr:ROK family protein [Geoalkalibacter subterraneus]
MNSPDNKTRLQARFLIGVDLGGTNCRMALVDGQGRVCQRERFSSREFDHVDALMAKIEVICREFESAVRRSGGEIVAL